MGYSICVKFLTYIQASSLSLAHSDLAGEFGLNYKAGLPPHHSPEGLRPFESFPIIDNPGVESHKFNALPSEGIANPEHGLFSSSPSGANAFQTDIFNPISSSSPPDMFNRKPENWYPFVKKAGIHQSAMPIQTNKFYGSFLAREFQHDTIYTFPYSLTLTDCEQDVCGMGVSHVEEETGFKEINMVTENPYIFGSKLAYSIILSAEELGRDTSVTTDPHTAFSASVLVAPAQDRKPVFSMPLLQGMAFITGIYDKATPVIGSRVSFEHMMLENSTDTRAGNLQVQDRRSKWNCMVNVCHSGQQGWSS